VSDNKKNLVGANRAAVLLMSLSEEEAAEVFKHMGPKEVQRLGGAMANMRSVSQLEANQVFAEFLQTADKHTSVGVDSKAYIRNVLTQALGKDKATGLMERIMLGGHAEGLEALKGMEPRAVAEMIRNEHPQIIAIILSFLDRDQSAAIISNFPDRLRSDTLTRIATLDVVQPAALRTLNEMLKKLAGASSEQQNSVGGPQVAAEILNFVESSIEGELLDDLKERLPELGQEIQDLMFVFDNLVDLDDKGIQIVLREISTDSLLVALKGADEKLREKFFKNMSKRAAEMLKEDLESKGPVRVSEVEGAQKEILRIARRLADEGKIVLSPKGAEEFI
jgi:flagellar motor switch protein FliG